MSYQNYITEYEQHKNFGKLLQKVKNDWGTNNITPEQVLELAKAFAQKNQFGFARRIFALVDQELDQITDKLIKKQIFQKYASYACKDPELIIDLKLDHALQILQRAGDDLNITTDSATLEVAGSIYFRKWELTGRMNELERAYWYNRRGFKQGTGEDEDKYSNGVNAAFFLDLLVALEENEARQAGEVTSPCAASRRGEADQIRQEVVHNLTAYLRKQSDQARKDTFWSWGTLSEAYFGLGNYRAGCYFLKFFLKKARKADGKWQIQATLRHFARLAELRDHRPGAPPGAAATSLWQCLAKVFPNIEPEVIESSLAGKVGIALSGGGFRASLFHLGVLARLAELDLLRHVEVISCVSGGSIIGPLYYQELGEKLMQVGPQKTALNFYIDLVDGVKKRFLKAVQKNFRTRIFSNLWSNVKMFWPGYSRTDRLGELLEKELYGVGKSGQTTCLSSLDIQFDQQKRDFSPREDNWLRWDKVPILVLNAATLNTGHNWQFAAHWMGESPAGVTYAIDKNARLRRLYYGEAGHLHQVGLGQAVAASAAVPAVLKPLELKNLYRRQAAAACGQEEVDQDLDVKLVDGGVYDNQGIASLLVEECTFILISDGSGQMETEAKPGGNCLTVLWRSNNILQKRVREAQYRELIGLRRAAILRGFAYVHLTKDLDADTINWIGYQGPQEPEPAWLGQKGLKKTYLDNKFLTNERQQKLAAIRTDLDAFGDQEAYALMASGYRQTDHEITTMGRFQAFPWQQIAPTKNTDIWPTFQKACRSKSLDCLLDVAQHKGFKICRLWLKSFVPACVRDFFTIAFQVLWIIVKYSFLYGMFLGLGRFCYLWYLSRLPDLTVPLAWIGIVFTGLALYVIFAPLHFPVLAFLFAWFHLFFIDRWYRGEGKID